jgi:predicted O-linked N-acetylglucosamine transferase (SPINDLY family)
MDYYLVDSDWSPKGLLDDYFVEKLVQLPSVVTFAAPENSPAVVDAPALKNGHITFGSFNRTSKLTQQTLDLWGNVLNEIPTAKMILGNVSDEPLQRQLENEFVKRGVAVERLTFHAKKSIPDYLALHGDVDFILDTFPYSGGTTTGFALWMGVPVLTYAWKSLAGRGGVVMLSRVDLHNEFTAHTPEQFVEMAKSWSQNVDGLQILRHQLRGRMQHSPKSKPENVAAGLEKGLRLMWERFCTGQSVESFIVTTQLQL